MIINKVLYSLLFVGLFINLNGQTITNPVIHSKSHPSLSIDSIIIDQSNSYIYLSVENMNTEGNAWFCADRDISLLTSGQGVKHQLQKSEGIPICPDSHKFEKTGEILSFLLIFPSIDKKCMEIDIVENCVDNCFSLIGISLDIRLNNEIRSFESAVKLYVENSIVEALVIFEEIEKTSVFPKEKHFAYTRYILPLIYEQLKDYDKAKAAYLKLEKSEVQEKQYFLSKLKENPFFDAPSKED